MSDTIIRVKITTLSNLFIGGSPRTFEIGGIDMYTITDYKGNPYIPSSTLKGNLRAITRGLSHANENARIIGEAYRQYLSELYQENKSRIDENGNKDERYIKLGERYEKMIDEASAEYLFGIEGFNHTPKLIFNDLLYVDNGEKPFSVDSKNTIDFPKDAQQPVANPRTYRTVRPGVEFSGEVHLYMMEKLPISAEVITQFIEHVLHQFNTGVYRLGNSGSRGYGRIQVEVCHKGGEHE